MFRQEKNLIKLSNNMKKSYPNLIILLGLLILFFLPFAEVAFACFILGLVMIIESVWPEKWGDDSQNV